MLHILWIVLKIIGMILLIILGLAVLSVCVILFVPLNYHGKAESFGTVDSIKAQLKFSWLLHLISGYVFLEQKEVKWQVRIFWKKLNVGKKEIRERDVKKTEKQEAPENLENDSVQEDSAQEEASRDKSAEKDNAKPGKKTSKTKKKGKRNILEKIKCTFHNICDNIKLLIKKKETLQTFITDEVHHLAWKRLKQETWRLLKFLKPKKLALNLHFGFEDPSVTGKVLAVLSMLYPFYINHVNLEPEFETEILEGDAYIKGKIKGLHLLIVICNLFFDKHVKATYHEISEWRK